MPGAGIASQVRHRPPLGDADRGTAPEHPRVVVAKRCPACGTQDVRRSHVRESEHGNHAFRSPYRCRRCNTRFWVVSRRTRIAVAAGGAFVVVVTLVSIGAVLSNRYAPHSAEMVEIASKVHYPEILVPVASLPDQAVNETHRFELQAAERMPAAELAPGER